MFKRIMIHRKRSLLVLASSLALIAASIGTAGAATQSPALTLTLLDEDIVIASIKGFPATASVDLQAVVPNGSGKTTLMTSASGRALAGFEVPEGFSGRVTITAESGSVKQSKSLAVEGDATSKPVTSTSTTPKKDAPAMGNSPTSTVVEEVDEGVTGGARSSSGTSQTLDEDGTAAATQVASTSTGKWLSGGTDTKLGDFRGSPIQSITTWSDNQEACESAATLGNYANKGVPVVLAIGGKWSQSWDQAASGGMNDIWTKCLTSMKQAWGSNDPADLYISLFHESNGTWYDWSVKSASDAANLKKAFHNFKQLQEKIIPGAQLGLTYNADHLAPVSREEMLPAAADIDWVGVDMYSMHMGKVDFGIYPALAAKVGAPVVVQEWGFKTQDNPAGFVKYMHDQFVKYGGTGSGHVIMENYFDLWDEYTVSDGTNDPGETASYKALF